MPEPISMAEIRRRVAESQLRSERRREQSDEWSWRERVGATILIAIGVAATVLVIVGSLH